MTVEDDGRDGTEPGERLTHWEGEPVHVWEALWGLPRLEAWDRIGSTNDRARALAREGALPFTVVLAEEQTAGRGRSGRRWVSPPGGLWMSVVIRAASPHASRLAPLLAGLAVCRAVEAGSPGLAPGLKWPNDVLLEGRKLCGILCETAADALVVGVGLNVRDREGLPGDATSLEAAAGGSVSRSAAARGVLTELRALLSRPTLRFDGPLRQELEDRDVLAGRRVEVLADRAGGKGGTARGIDAEGALVVEDDRGRRSRVVSGTVRIAEGSPGAGEGSGAPSGPGDADAGAGAGDGEAGGGVGERGHRRTVEREVP